MARPKVLPFIVAAAVAMIVITDVSIVRLLTGSGRSGLELFYSVWPLMVTSTTAIIFVMSSLYHALQGLLEEIAAREEKARHAGFRDPLTSLGNRELLGERLEQSVRDLRRSGRRFALLMLDLDRFKDVNDVHGHPAGDELLVEVASRLRELVRETDTLIRFGGDEFIVLQNNIEIPEEVDRLSHRIRDAIQRPFGLDVHELTISVSIGAVLAEGTPEVAAEYGRKADIALYEAKRLGRNQIQIYSHELDSKLQRRKEIERELADAISLGTIDVHYQPQVTRKGEVIAAEALLRWKSSKSERVSASEIVAIAEETGLIRSLGMLVFGKACKAARQWPGLTVAVNFSPSQLLSNDLPADLARICRAEGVECERIELELTESLFLKQHECCEDLIAVLRKHGFRIALDDFGAGYSSLQYLRRFKVDKVKLEKGFSDGTEARQNVAIVRAAVMLAHSLGLVVIAEGIETAEQEDIAVTGGCDGFQGFRFAPPMTARQLTQYLKKARSRRAA